MRLSSPSQEVEVESLSFAVWTNRPSWVALERVWLRFNATVKLGEDFKVEFDFSEGGNGAAEKIDGSRPQSIGICPVCKQGQVFEVENAYIC